MKHFRERCLAGMLALAVISGLLLPAMAQSGHAAHMAQANEGTLTGTVQQTKTLPPPGPKDAQAAEILARVMARNNLSADMVNTIRILPAEELNAATDGNTIYFSSGLWDKLTTNDQKAFVIAHELSHIQKGHIAKTQFRRVGFSLANYLILNRWLNVEERPNSQLYQLVSAAGLSLLDNRFSRSMEYEADDNGMKLLVAAGYQPQAALEVFNVFERYSPDGTPEFLRSHPLSRNRINTLVNKYQTLRLAS
ncbi:MAG: M48 family metallopeptidase [Candidatus Melainabacteria bacterium]